MTAVDLEVFDDDPEYRFRELILFNTSTNDDNTLENVGTLEDLFPDVGALSASAVTFSRDDEQIYLYYPETTVRFDENQTLRLV